MSFNFNNIKPKTQLASPQVASPSSAQSYNFRVQRIQQQLQKRLTHTNDIPFSVRIGFLTLADQTALTSGITALGYTCTTDNGILTIQ